MQIPSLVKLARASGDVRSILSPAERIRLMLHAGELPTETTCIRCQFPTSDILNCSIECERTYTENRNSWLTAVLFLVSPMRAMLYASDEGAAEVRGRELVVRAPLQMCLDCQKLFANNRRLGELRTLLLRVPLYEALLGQYPGAGILTTPQAHIDR